MKKTLRKKITSFIVAVCLTIGGVGLLNFGKISLNNSHAASSLAGESEFYGAQLSGQASKFYAALESMKTQGKFKVGDDFDLLSNGTLTTSQIAEYAKGNDELVVAFEKAKDAYYLDHPEVFYVDFDSLDLSFTKTANGKYEAVIGAGDAETYIADGLNDLTLQTEIDYFEGEGILNFIPSEEDLNGFTKTQLIEYVNEKIVNSLSLGFSQTFTEVFSSSAYGAMKYFHVSAEGYARLFKSCMNAVGVECVQVVGYVANEDASSFKYHSWNCVKLDDGKWYAVDTALNDVQSTDKYLLAGSEILNVTHIENMILSSNGTALKTPAIEKQGLADTLLSVETSVAGGEMIMAISYNGKSATELALDELYLVATYKSIKLGNFITTKIEPIYLTEESTTTKISKITLDDTYPFVIVGVTAKVPDEETTYTELDVKDFINYKVIKNEVYGADEEARRPEVSSVSAVCVGSEATTENVKTLNSDEVWEITLKYDENLVVAVDSVPVNIRVFSTECENIEDYVIVENVVFDEKTPNEIKFKFTPSKKVTHANMAYHFVPTNILKQSDVVYLEPNYATIQFERGYLDFSKVYGSESVNKEEIKKPTIVDYSNIEISSWSYLNNHFFTETQKSEMVLISTKPTTNEIKGINTQVKSVVGEGNELLKVDAFELEFAIFGIIPTVTSGTYFKVALAFPEGYSYKDLCNGKTFEVYQFEKDSYGTVDYDSIEKLDAVVTEYGITTETTNMGYFAVVARTSETSAEKYVYARGVNFGGNIEKVAENDTEKLINSISSGEITYAITTNDGYEIEAILLNGQDVSNKLANGKLTLTYEDLASNNVVEVVYVSSESYDAESDETNLTIEFLKNQKLKYVNDSQPNKLGTGTIVLIIVCSVVFAVAAVAVTTIIVKKKVIKK